MIISRTKGDLIKNFKAGEYAAIAHGCNCRNNMGGGIALTLKNLFPEVYSADTKMYNDSMNKPYNHRPNYTLLGEVSSANTKYGSIYNLYTQLTYGREKKVYISYDAFYSCFRQLNEIKTLKGKLLGIPLIGAGLGGGDWNTIVGIINEVTPDINIEVVEYSRNF